MFDTMSPAQRFERSSPEDQDREIRRTRKAVGELILRPRTDFPGLVVLVNGKPVSRWVVDDAFTAARPGLRAIRGRGTPEEALAIFSACVAPAQAREDERIRLREPPRHGWQPDDAARLDAAREGLPPDLLAPLML